MSKHKKRNDVHEKTAINLFEYINEMIILNRVSFIEFFDNGNIKRIQFTSAPRWTIRYPQTTTTSISGDYYRVKNHDN